MTARLSTPIDSLCRELVGRLQLFQASITEAGPAPDPETAAGAEAMRRRSGWWADLVDLGEQLDAALRNGDPVPEGVVHVEAVPHLLGTSRRAAIILRAQARYADNPNLRKKAAAMAYNLEAARRAVVGEPQVCPGCQVRDLPEGGGLCPVCREERELLAEAD